MDQHRGRETAECGASDLFGQDHAGHHIQPGATVFFVIAHAQNAKITHSAQHVARHHALLFPGVGLGRHFGLDEPTQLIADHVEVFVERAAGCGDGFLFGHVCSSGSSLTSGACPATVSPGAQ